MNKDEHLTQKEIIGYSDRALKGEEKHRVGRHLLLCNECRRRKPPPTREDFLRALFEDEEDFERNAD